MGNNDEYKDMEKLDEWFEWMTNKDAKLRGITSKSPRLSKKKAFTILYSLQEFLGIVDDYIEICKDCGRLTNDSTHIDLEYGSDYKDLGLARKPKKYEQGHYCEDCVSNRFGWK